MTEAQEARDDAVRTVAASEAPFVAVAFDALSTLCRWPPLEGDYSSYVTSEDVWALLRFRGISPPAEPRAMGPVMQRGIREGLIRPVGYRQSTNPKHHADVMRVYEVVR